MELFYLITGTILFGEALALFIGIFIIQKGKVSWNTKMNRIYLIVDIISGLSLALNYFFFENIIFNIFVLAFIVVAIILHFKRTSEYLLKKDHIFCANKALYIVNNFKLILLFGSLFLVLPF